MFKKLHNYAVRCPIVDGAVTPINVARRFKASGKLRCVISVGADNAPNGVYLAADPKRRQEQVLVIDKAHTQEKHVSALAKVPEDVLSRGAVLVDAQRVAGWLPPEALTSWLAKMARASQRRADDRSRAVRHAQEQSLVFLANMSHELRTPLNAIIGYADLMREGTFGQVRPAQYAQYIDSIHLSGEHLLSAINSVLNLARVDAGVVNLEEKPISIDRMIDQAIEMMQTQADTLDVRIMKTVASDFPMVYGDPQLLRQALLNLLSNAVKFSPPGSRVRVSAARTLRSGVRITVGDRGPGIPDAEIERILEPFKQASHGPGRTGVGTGLGLSLAKAFLELHEGRLQLLSQEGEGTRAVMTIPSGRVLDEKAGFQRGFAFVRGGLDIQKQSA